MKILIDIGHPAHVHYFKNFISIMQKKGHSFVIVARDKEVTFKLLKSLGIHYFSRGQGSRNIILKIFGMFKIDMMIYRLALRHQPDFFLSFSSEYASHVAAILGKPNIVFNDTEHVQYMKLLCYPFADAIVTPAFFSDALGEKHISFAGYMESCYLQPRYFTPDESVLAKAGLKAGERYVVVRFVSWSANHDVGQRGLSYDYKLKLIKELTRHTRVIITSEGNLPEELLQYKLDIPPEYLHDLLYFADLYIGEGSTTASECSMLGTPNIYINSLYAGNVADQEKNYGLSFRFKTQDNVIEKALELLSTPDLRRVWQDRRKKMLEQQIDVTAFMVWLVEQFPQSVRILKKNPDYQYNFR